MARHKVYLTATPCKCDGSNIGIPVTPAARFKIDMYVIDINADLQEDSDIAGKIVIQNVNGNVVVKIDCPHYKVDIEAANNLCITGTHKQILRKGLV